MVEVCQGTALMAATTTPVIECDAPTVKSLCQDLGETLENTVTNYSSNFADSQETKIGVTAAENKYIAEQRVENARNLTERFYSIVTDFYEYGYGFSFHFAPVYDEHSFTRCIQEYEHGVARSLQAKPGMKILDIGCGVGGPGREIASYSGAKVIGLNYSDYQLRKAKKHTEKAKLSQQCTYVKGDFCAMEFEDNTFDGAFALEATCHAKDPVDVYSEAFRVLKPGAIYVDATWALTDTYDATNPKHEKIKNDIMFGNSLPDIRTKQALLSCMRKAGFEVVQVRNAEREGDKPWYHFLVGNGCCSLQAFRVSALGRGLTHATLTILEALSVVPAGTTKVHSLLQVGASALIESGKLDIFSPMYIIVARKPLST